MAAIRKDFRKGCHFTLLLVQLALIVPHIRGQCSFSFSEGTPIGSYLFYISATSSNGPVTFTASSVSTASLVNISDSYNASVNEWRANATLNAQLDRDYEPSLRLLGFQALDSSLVQEPTTCLVYNLVITDINDNPPAFQDRPYNLEVAENETVGITLRAGISAFDPDNGPNGSFILSSQFPSAAVATTFNTTTRRDPSTTRMLLDILLAGPLDYETRSYYTFSLMARDTGGLNSTETVSVTVIDVQDTPPFFQLDSYRANITEHLPAGTSIIQVLAEDGDRGFPNSIRYSIVEGNTDYFAIDSIGIISSLVVLDRDNTTVVGREGVFALTVRATELDGPLPQHGNTTTDVLVVIVVDDINDHAPTFSGSGVYTAFVREDTPQSSLVYFEGDGYIKVSDADQGRNSYFNLTVERDGVPWPVLVSTPVEIYSEALVLLRVMDSNAIREAAGTHISFQLVAREISTTQRHSSTTEVVITIERVTEQTTTPAPPKTDAITAPDVVVFIIGFLVVFNIVVSALIIWYMRKRSQQPKQGLVRRGSKYYVNGEPQTEPLPTVQNGSVVSTLKPETTIVEVDAKDRSDVVSLNERLSFKKSSREGSTQVDDNHNQTKRKAPTVPGGSRLFTQAEVNTLTPTPASVSGVLAKRVGVTINTSTAGTTFINPVHEASSRLSSTMTPSVASASTVSATASTVSQTTSMTTAKAIPSLATTTTATITATSPATAATTKLSVDQTTGPAVQPVTRFSTKGPVSTSIAAVPGHSVASAESISDATKVSVGNPSSSIQSGPGSAGTAHASTTAPGAASGKRSDLFY